MSRIIKMNFIRKSLSEKEIIEIIKIKSNLFNIKYFSSKSKKSIQKKIKGLQAISLEREFSSIPFEKWNTEYFNYGVLDGETWEVNFETETLKKQIQGANLYPDNFDEFLEIINKVMSTLYNKFSDVKYVNVHISNISFPKTIEQLEYFVYEHGSYNVEDIIMEVNDGYTIWTVPRNSCIGDIVLFFHSKTAIQSIRKLETAVNSDETVKNKEKLRIWLKKARNLYELYGGKIFAIGRIDSVPEFDDAYDDNMLPYKNRVYAEVTDLFLLTKPIDISEFNSFILISRQSGITKLPANEFEKLKEIIMDKNEDLPRYFIESEIENFNLSNVKYENFLTNTKLYRKRFLIESFFRSYYVDYFIKIFSDGKYYSECNCYTKDTPNARVDNVFKLNNKYYLLEVKLNIYLEKKLLEQLEQYIKAEYLFLDKERTKQIFDFEREFMFVIDKFSLYKFYSKSKQLVEVIKLDKVNNHREIKSIILKSL